MSPDPRSYRETVAGAWDGFVESGADYYRMDVHGPALIAARGEVEGLRVLNLGSGNDRNTELDRV